MIETCRMDVITFNQIASTEKSARKYLLGFCWKNHQRFCPRCRERKLYRVADKLRRCARCHYTFHDFSQRFIKGCAFTFQQWLWFMKLYELDVPSDEIAKQMTVSYATVLKARDLLRRAVLAQALDANRYYEYGIWPGPGRKKTSPDAHDPPVFGVMDLGGYIICDLLPDLTIESLLHFKLNFCLETASLGQVVYTAPYQQYSMLVSCSPDLWPTQFIQHNAPRLPADGSEFWAFAKKRLSRVRGIQPTSFPLYLKEWEMRYNNRNDSLIPILAGALCGFVPQGL